MYKKQTLTNNVRLLTIPLQETQTASLVVLTKVGSRNESASISGASHFIEHLMFKGTKRRPTTLDLAKELDSIGAEFNAFTGKDLTGYFIKSDAKHLSLSIDVLSDILLHSKFDPQEITKEKGVIIEEINMYQDNPLMYVEDLLEQTIYGKSDPLGRSISGSRQTVSALTQKDLLAYKNNFYTGSNIVIAVAGRFGQKQLAELKRKFSFPIGRVVKKIPIRRPAARGIKLTIKNKETEQIQLALGLPAYPYSHPRLYALQLLAIILGGNMSSRLFLSVRERNGLAYFIRTGVNIYEDAGALTIQAGLDKQRLNEAIKLIVAELKRAVKDLTAEELRRAKDYLYGQTAIEMENSLQLANFYAQQELMLKKVLTPAEKLKKIEAVNLNQLKKTAQEIIDLKRISLAAIGPLKGEEARLKTLLK